MLSIGGESNFTHNAANVNDNIFLKQFLLIDKSVQKLNSISTLDCFFT